MRTGSGRQIAGGAMLLAIALASVPSAVPSAARKQAVRRTVPPGSITLVSPQSNDAVRGDEVTVAWIWKSGSIVKSTSRVNIQISPDGVAWTTVASGLAIRDGSTIWNTTTVEDYIYALRAQVARTTIASIKSPIYVDNTAPVVHITHPSEGEIVLEDSARVYFATVIGTVTLRANVFDSLSGIASLVWKLDGEEIGQGTPLRYNFSLKPGRHDLTVVATDRSGNAAEHTIVLIAAPGPSAAEQAPPVPAPSPEPPIPLPSPEPPVPIPSPPAPSPDPLPVPIPRP